MKETPEDEEHEMTDEEIWGQVYYELSMNYEIAKRGAAYDLLVALEKLVDRICPGCPHYHKTTGEPCTAWEDGCPEGLEDAIQAIRAAYGLDEEEHQNG